MKKVKFILALTVFFLLNESCKKDTLLQYQVNGVTVTQPGANKNNLKSDFELVSITYTDLFGTTISEDELQDITQAYNSFGDSRIIIDMIAKNFLNDPGLVIPAKAQMQADVSQFVTDTYKKFYIREPNEYEKWYLVNLINSDTSITPELVYYAFATSNEYRYY